MIHHDSDLNLVHNEGREALGIRPELRSRGALVITHTEA